jgi:Ca2+:H+ antiporter
MCSSQTIPSFLAKDAAAKLVIIFVPLGIFAGVVCRDPAAVFAFNFLAIMGLAPQLNFATKLLLTNVGYHFSGLVNAIFGSAVEIIVSSQRISHLL